MGYLVNNEVRTGGIPTHIVEPFLKELLHLVDVFVETGTAAGDSVRWASKRINECHTIELIENRQVQTDEESITWHTGDSPKILNALVGDMRAHKLMNNIERRYCLFWLDAHYSGTTPNYSGYKDCPLLEELEIISQYDQDSIILIDDARLFMGNPPYPNNPSEWPTIQQIFKKFDEKFKFFVVTIVDDYILAFPDRIEWIYQKHWMENFSKRYPNDDEKLKQQTKAVYEAFQKYIQ